MIDVKEENQKIPQYLIYEELDGIPVYYRGYKEVIEKNKTLEDIMGYGELQWFIINVLGDYLKDKLGREYRILLGEGGLHLGHKKNLSIDIGIYLKSQFSWKQLKNQYSEHPPKVVIEVDTKADPDIFNYSNYYIPKTQQLLDFGVEQVVWLFTDSEKVMLARRDEPWMTVNWSDEIAVLGHSFVIEQILREQN